MTDTASPIVRYLHEWEKCATVQLHDCSCVPAGFEMLVRYRACLSEDDLSRFQVDFDLGVNRNCFTRVSAAITHRYSHLTFSIKGTDSAPFDNGAEKCRFLERQLNRGVLTLASVAIPERGGFHIMPLVGMSGSDFVLVDRFFHAPQGSCIALVPKLYHIRKARLAHLHDQAGGRDLVWLECGLAC